METLNYDLEKFKSAVSDKTKVILAVNLLGNPNDFKEIEKIINNKDIFIIEDNCESLGAEFQKNKTGTIGLLGTFSFFFSQFFLSRFCFFSFIGAHLDIVQGPEYVVELMLLFPSLPKDTAS